jgi:hypothetical protein
MPFTLSHPAAVLPIRRIGILSALITGSVMPDALYFIPKVPKSHFGHSLQGIFLFCLPAGLVCLWVFHNFLKDPLISLVPIGYQRRLQSEKFGFLPAMRFAQICISILVGAFTHVCWDSFTHQEGWAVKHFNTLSSEMTVADRLMPLSDILQHLSTAGGIAVLFYYFFHWLLRTQEMPELDCQSSAPESKSLLLIWSAVGAFWPGVYVLATPSFWVPHGRVDLAALVTTIATKIILLELTGYSLLWHLRRRNSQKLFMQARRTAK